MNTIVNITGLTLKCLGTSDESAIRKAKKKEYDKKYREKNKEKLLIYNKLRNKIYYQNNKNKIINRSINWQKNNKSKFSKNRKNYYQNNKNKINLNWKNWYHKNKEEILLLKRERRKIDIQFRIAAILRVRINHVLNGKYKKSKKTKELIGISIEGLIKHLESTFKLGMSWENRHLIHIDHIRPCASFDLSKPEEQAKCFHYTNLQVLWAHENLSKGSKYVA